MSARASGEETAGGGKTGGGEERESTKGSEKRNERRGRGKPPASTMSRFLVWDQLTRGSTAASFNWLLTDLTCFSDAALVVDRLSNEFINEPSDKLLLFDFLSESCQTV